MKHGTRINKVLVVFWGFCLKDNVWFVSKLLAVQGHILTSVRLRMCAWITSKVSSCGSAPGDGRLLGFAG